jgi:hypothetical protein
VLARISWVVRHLPFLFLVLACSPSLSRPPEATKSPALATDASAPCGDVVGAWSPVVSGLRARLVTSGSQADHSALHIVLEVENVSGHGPLAVDWEGYIPFGFVTFRLEDAAGTDREPAWALGGNSPSGKIRAIFPPNKVVSYVIHDSTFGSMMGGRILRIGAFWGRELPSNGSRRFLRARVTGSPALVAAVTYEGEEPAATSTPASVWVGSLDVPLVCIQ